MKKLLFSSVVAMIIFSSCSQVYTYYQVYTTIPCNNKDKTSIYPDGIYYSDDDCALYYSFWSENGNVSFAFFNKSDSIIYINLKKTFFINRDYCLDYYKGRAWSYSEEIAVAYSEATAAALYGRITDPTNHNKYYYGSIASSNQASTISAKNQSASFKESDIIAIAPSSYKIIICEYAINTERYHSCNLLSYPATPDSIEFDETNTPIRFVNYITYNKGTTGKDKTIENQFYVSKITNIPEPYVFRFDEIFIKYCDGTKKSYNPQRYNKVVDFQTNQHFYLKMAINSYKRLYKKSNKTYYQSSDYYTLQP